MGKADDYVGSSSDLTIKEEWEGRQEQATGKWTDARLLLNALGNSSADYVL